MGLKSGFFEVYKSAKLILSIPKTTTSAERSFLSLKIINKYCRRIQKQDRMNNLSIISIEKELFFKLRTNKNKCYEDFIQKNIEIVRRVKFEFK